MSVSRQASHVLFRTQPMADAVERMEWCRERWRWMVRTRRVKEDGTREISSTLQLFSFFFLGSVAGSSV